MTDKTIQERLRDCHIGKAPNGEYVVYVPVTLREQAADMIDRLTAAPSEDMAERMLDAYWTKVGVYKPGELTADNRKWPDRDIQAMKAAIAAMPSADQIRRDEREKCAQVAEKLGPYWQGVPAAIRARNEEK